MVYVLCVDCVYSYYIRLNTYFCIHVLYTYRRLHRSEHTYILYALIGLEHYLHTVRLQFLSY